MDEAGRKSRRGKRGENAWTVIFWLLIAVGAWIQVSLADSGDKGWLLIAARHWLSGDRLYVNIFEINPPLIIWIYSIPSYAADRLGLSDGTMLGLFGLLFSWLCGEVTMNLWKAHPVFAARPQDAQRLRRLVFVILITITSPVYFFDRDSIFLLGVLPYLVRWMPGLSAFRPPIRQRMLIGVLAGFGFCIKPHTILVFAGIQLLIMLRSRNLSILTSPENLLIYACGLTYGLAVCWLTPEYFTVMLPMALATYSGYNDRGSVLLYLVEDAMVFGIAFVDFRWWRQSPYRPDVIYWLAIIGLMLCYGLANNGWGYSYNPSWICILILNGWVWLEYAYFERQAAHQGVVSRSDTFGRRACICDFSGVIALNMLIIFHGFSTGCDQDIICRTENRITQYFAENQVHTFGAMVAVFTVPTEIERKMNARLVTRFNHLWMIPAFLKQPASFGQTHDWIIRYVAEAYATDLDNRKPEIVLIDTGTSFSSATLRTPLTDLFSHSDAFRLAWRHYHWQADYDFCNHLPPGKPCAMRYSIFRRDHR